MGRPGNDSLLGIDSLDFAAMTAAELRTVGDWIPAICWVSDTEGRAVWMNRRGHAFFGEEALAIDNAMRLVHPDDRDPLMAEWAAARASGTPIERTVRTRGPDGRYRPLLSSAQPIRDAAEAITGWFGLQVDLSGDSIRRRHEEFLRNLSEATRGMIVARDILEVTSQMLGRHLGVSRVAYSETVPGEYGSYRVEADWTDGSTPSFTGEWRMADAFPRLVDHFATGKPLVVSDAYSHPLIGPDDARRLAVGGIRAAICAPLVKDGAEASALLVHQTDPREFSTDEVRLVEDVAERTWATLTRARSEQRLAESEALLASFFENAPIAMYLKDQEGRYLRLNQEMADFLGVPIERALGRTGYDFVEFAVADKVTQMDRKALVEGVQASELNFAEREQSLLSIRFPIAFGDGPATMLGGFSIDLTEQRRAEAALERSREALFQSEKLNALGSLMAGVSHELNNPLSIVVAQALMIERLAQGSELGDRAQKMRKAADRCARIVQTFLAMARQRQPERAAVELDAIADAALELAAYGLKTEGVVVDRQLAGSLPTIAADADQLHQVIINLIVNAQQAMAGASDRRLTLRTDHGAEPGTVALDLIDTGPGVPQEARRRIFEPFFTTKPQGEGTGIGLSFSRGLVEAHGGRLELMDSASGAHFRITLPIQAAGAGEAAQMEEAPAPQPAERRALVVDDEREIAESLADFLSLEGFRCDIADGGAAAQAILSQGHAYDLVVSDLRMPGIDGLELYGWLLSRRPDLASRVAFATGDTLGLGAARFLAEARRPVLEKPFLPEAVQRLLQQMELA